VTDHRITESKFGMDKMLSGLLLEEFRVDLHAHNRLATIAALKER
jgi:protein subunit release factor A